MNSDRIKEIQQQTAHPDSQSVMWALKQVWNECAQETQAARAEGMETVYEKVEEIGLDNCSCVDGEKCESCYTVDEILKAIRQTTQDNKEG